MPSTSIQNHSQSSFSKLKLWFNKGSEMPGDNKASHQAKRKQQRDVGSARYVAGQNTHTADGAATRPYPISPRGPRLSPQAVHVEARNNSSSEGDNVSNFSSLRSTPDSSLKSVQSHFPPNEQYSKRPKPRNPKPGAIPISLPQPRQSLLDHAAANYVDVQNPARAAHPPNKKPTPVADPKPSRNQDEQRPKEFRPDQPVKKVKQVRAEVVTPPTHQRSQKTVVRKAVPPRTHGTDNHFRQVYRETRFEDFMGKDSPAPLMPPPPLPSADHRLSRPFAAAVPVNQPMVEEDVRPGTASTAALSVNGSQAQTWLRYDLKHGESARHPSTDTPFFPRRIPEQIKYTPCQTCQKEVHPSTAFSYNGTYVCEDCAATGRWTNGDKKKESLKVKKNKVGRKPVSKTSVASFKEKASTTLSTSTTLLGSLSPRLSPRLRGTDVATPGTEREYSPSPQPSSPAPSSTNTSSPRSPYFATPDAHGRYPRYRIPPPPPIVTAHVASDEPVSPLPESPFRKPKPASSIYPSTPWRLSRPPSTPSIPAVPEKYLTKEVENTKGERDTIYRAEIEEDIINSYAVDSPVSSMSEPGNNGGERGSGEYVAAGWRTRRNVF
ncbi:MAG: hypothetical protein Q9169_002925 [Polycauliona sp. 2 TL-2023]